MKLADLKLVAHNPAIRLAVIVGSVIASAVGGSAVTIWSATRAVDSAFYGFNVRLDALTAQAADQRVSNNSLTDSARLLTGQVQQLGTAIDQEKAARMAEAAAIAGKLEQSERSRRAEENGLLQQFNSLVTRMDTLMDRARSGATGTRGDITLPAMGLWNDGGIYVGAAPG